MLLYGNAALVLYIILIMIAYYREYGPRLSPDQCCPPPPNAATPLDFRTPPPPVIFRGVKNGVKSEISLQLLSVTSFSYTYFITYFISYFNENVLLSIIINRLSSTIKDRSN